MATSISTNSNLPLKGVIFDMDGTLTIPNLDFAEMYQRCGVDRSDDILAAIARMDADNAARANAVVEEMEEEGRRTLQLMPGTVAVLQWLVFYKIPMALVTRNTFQSTLRLQELLIEAGLPETLFDPIVARDTQPLQPPKPDTAALQYIASQWNIGLPSRQLVMVGDSPSNDIQFGKNAGVATALLWQRDELNNDQGADRVVSQLSQLPRWLFQAYNLAPVLSSKQPAPQPTSDAAKAAYTGDLPALQSLPSVEVVKKDPCGNTPLIWASEAGHHHIVAFLLDVIKDDTTSNCNDNAYVNARGHLGSTAVSRAARHGHHETLHLLLKYCQTTANIPNHKLQYPLHVAAFRQHVTCVERLLEAGAHLDIVDAKGRTPLQDTRCPKVVALLRSAKMESSK